MTTDKTIPSPQGGSKTKRYSGVIIPMVTPATDEGKIDLRATNRLINAFVDAGTDPFIFGTTGEASSLSTEEKVRLTKAVCSEFAARTTIYVGVSSNCFSDTIDLCDQIGDLGADVAVANLPSYYPLSPDQMLGYFERLADSIRLPLVLYNIPSTTHMSIPLDVIETLSHHPGIVGFKDSERDEDRLRKAIAQYKDRDDFSHFIGWAAQSVNALKWGSDGLVPSTGNFVPQLYRDLYHAVLDGDEASALRLQDSTNEISTIYQEGRGLGDSLAALKVLLSEAGFCGTGMFPPLSPVPESEQSGLRTRAAEVLGR